jgi:phosphoribosylformimino-5-aminoimidazole carboxamide ribotide isomerase/phosphoribosyl-ATP pyrophosphohydrolase/phosphoribosyl-AMP cyclohydrolase
MGEEQIQEIKQLIIRDETGRIIDVGLMNGKCYGKSIERSRLWLVHRETGRVLPLELEHRLVGIRDMNRWYEAVISPAQTGSPAAAMPDGSAVSEGLRHEESVYEEQEEDREGGEDFFTIPAAERRGKPFEPPDESARGAVEDDSFARAGASAGGVDFLEKLENLVRERYRTMPEGSYTTHLFASGGEKIRKKTGEEAVELILAGSREEILFEASDLIYHMCVLLVSEGLSFRQVFALLEERHNAG